MAFIDEIKFYISAGKGGDGVVRWRHEKGKEYGGPSGGNGGKGGDVYLRGKRDLALLNKYRNIKEFRASDGSAGEASERQGKGGEDLFIDLPVGSIVTNLKTRRTYELLHEDQTILILRGGKGGFGNAHFKSSTNIRPKEFTLGEKGQESEFRIELQLIADIGLVGLPNAGKSSLLNALTNAKAKVAGYAFTTLEPNLGAFYEFVIADIPGLIEGAAEGKGLGHKFLKHIKRTRMILHLISLEDKDIYVAYKTVRGELEKFDQDLLDKKEIVVLSKTDLVSKEDIKNAIAYLKRKKVKNIQKFSIIDDKSVKKLSDVIIKKLRGV